MENTFANFKPIELNSNPSKEDIAKYYLENNISTNNEFLDSFFGIQLPEADNSDTKPIQTKHNIKEILSTPIPKFNKSSTSYDPDKIEKGEYILEYFQNKGLTREQAAGIVGNLHAESNLNTTALGDNGSSFGIAQWHKNRFDKLKNFAVLNQKNVADLDLQLDYLWHELQTTESDAFKHLLNATTVQEAAKSFAHKFERMKNYSNQREVFANMYYNQS